MEQTKKPIRLNVVDGIILLVILGAAAFFVWRYIYAPKAEEKAKVAEMYSFTIVMDSNEISNDSFEGKIAVGDKITEKSKDVELGTIVAIDTEPSRSYAATDDGRIVLAPRPLHSRMILTVEGTAQFSEEGGMLLDDLSVYNNSYITTTIGNSIFSFRIIQITKGARVNEAESDNG